MHPFSVLNAIRIAVAAFILAAVGQCSTQAQMPVTPNASPEARSLLSRLHAIQGKQILSGQAEPAPTGDLLAASTEEELTRIQQITGKTPMIRAFDLFPVSGSKVTPAVLPVTQRALAWGQSNGIVAIQWHWLASNRSGGWDYRVRSAEEQTNGWRGFDLDHALIPGTPERDELLAGIDAAARQLGVLRDAHIPVLFRPLPEGSGGWFWWGAKGPESFKKLWRLMFDRITEGHHLTNLVWVYNPATTNGLASWYPGDEFVDVISLDRYAERGEFSSFKGDFETLSAFSKGRKVLALSETGAIPDPDALVRDHAAWAYFCTWSGKFILDGQINPSNHLAHVYSHPFVKTHP